MSRLIAIFRSPRFSPEKVEQDAAILRAVTAELRRMGHTVTEFSEHDFQRLFAERPEQVCADLIFGMYREEATLDLIEYLETHFHIPCVNPASGIRRVTHAEQINLLHEVGALIPPTIVVNTPSQLSSLLYPCWLKQGRGWSQSSGDVVYVRNQQEALTALPHFIHPDGILCVVASTHIEGRHEKFYRPGNGVLSDILPIYGGDAIHTSDGRTFIIDINDWPSFSTCRESAALSIAQYIDNKIPPEVKRV